MLILLQLNWVTISSLQIEANLMTLHIAMSTTVINSTCRDRYWWSVKQLNKITIFLYTFGHGHLRLMGIVCSYFPEKTLHPTGVDFPMKNARMGGGFSSATDSFTTIVDVDRINNRLSRESCSEEEVDIISTGITHFGYFNPLRLVWFSVVIWDIPHQIRWLASGVRK